MISIDVVFVQVAIIFRIVRADVTKMFVLRDIIRVIVEHALNAYHLANLVIQLVLDAQVVLQIQLYPILTMVFVMTHVHHLCMY